MKIFKYEDLPLRNKDKISFIADKLQELTTFAITCETKEHYLRLRDCTAQLCCRKIQCSMKKTRIDDMEVLILSSKKPKYIEMEDKKEDKKSDIFDYYFPVVQITTTITFIGCWLYAIVCYGFFLGVGLGWFPSLIIAVIVGFLWPLMAILIAIMIILVILVIIFG